MLIFPDTRLLVFLSYTSSGAFVTAVGLTPAPGSYAQRDIWAKVVWWIWKVNGDHSPQACCTVKETVWWQQYPNKCVT